MKRFLLLAFILLNINLILCAQSEPILLTGKVVDRETREGIVFVSIGIEGTAIGAASNPDGYFELRIPAAQKEKALYFSAIGYKNASFSITELLARPGAAIELLPQSYDIASVDVAAESMVLQRILRTAAERIPQNYIAVPVNLELFYEERSQTDGEATPKGVKAIVDLYDAKGYAKPSWIDAFSSRSYKVSQAQANAPAYSFRQAAMGLDELLEMDIARLSNTVLNPGLFNGYELRMEDNTRFDGDSVWIISYKAKALDLAHTGSFYPDSFEGKIYISHSTYAVLRNEIRLTETKSHPQGRSLAVKGIALSNTQMNITTGYKKLQGKYVLASIDAEKQFTSISGKGVYESSKLVLLEMKAKNTQLISGRNYFVHPKSNEAFWNSFTVPSN